MAEDDLFKRANAYRSGEFTAAKSRASARKTNANGTPANKGIGRLLADAPAENFNATPASDQPKDFWAGLGETLNKPVIKQIIDGISTPLYAVDNTLGNIQHRMQDASKAGQARGEVGIGNLGNTVQTAWEGLNPGSVVQDIVKGVGQGLSGGLGGNANDVKTGADLVKSGQEFNGIDPNTEQAHWIQGGLGLATDVALDPLNAIGAGKAVVAAKGARVGAKKFAEEAAIAKKEGRAISDTVEATKWQNAKRQAGVEVDKYKNHKLDIAQAKQTKKAIKKSSLDSVDFLMENVSTLRPAVLRALIKTPEDITKVMTKIEEGAIPTAKLDEFVNKLDPTTPDHVVTDVAKAAEPTPSVGGLSAFKAPTMDEKLFDALGTLRTTNKVPRYSPEVIKNVKDAMTVKATQQAAKQVPDVQESIKAIKEMDAEFRAPGKDGKPGPGLSVPYKTAEGKRYSLSAQDLIDSLDPKDVKFMEAFNALDPSLQKFKSAATTSEKAVSDETLMTLGIRKEDIPLLKQGVPLSDITDELSVGDIKSITRDIRNGEIPDQAIAHLHGVAGTKDRESLAKFIEANSATEGFKKTAAQLAKYGTHRTGATPLPRLGVSGHGVSAIPGRGFTADDILAAKTPANPEQSQKFLEAIYNQTALNLAALPQGAKLRGIADDVFAATIDVQRAPAGKLRTKRGASTKGPGTTAKFETKYNTHSAMHRIQVITDELRKMPELAKNKSKFDDAYMAVLSDVDQRLRLAGFDQHLSNMRLMGDKLNVRLAPSDVFSSLTKQQRTDWIHGNPMRKVFSREMHPTTVLDVAEILVRSATKLGPDGAIDMKALVTNALHTLTGKFSSLERGKREIASNLDVQTAYKNDQEILREMDKLGNTGENFAKLHLAAKGPEKNAVVKVAMEKYPEEFKTVASRRINEVPLEITMAFIKQFGEKPTVLSDLINKNMRNASVYGGSVAKQIGEASADYTRKVLDHLDNGTAGDFLSELVIHPPLKIADDVARQIAGANQKLVQDSVATAQEMKHAKASAKKAGTKGNVEAYQKDTQLMEEVAKPPKDINTEIAFDLAQRERNKDLLYRVYGFSKFFNKRAGMPLSFDAIANSSHAASLLMTGFHGIIRGWRARGITPEQLRVAMKTLGDDTIPNDAIAEELKQVMNGIFDPSRMNFLEKNSVGIDHFNKVLKSVGFDEKKFFIPEDILAEDIPSVWRNWDITHVEDFLSKMMRAVTQTAEDVSMGASFSKHFGSAVPGKGLVKISDKSKSNPFFPLIDSELHYPKEIAEEMVHIGRLMTESRSFTPGTKLHTFVTKVMDPVINTLKMTQTTMKPGHHVMSVIGDGWRNHLALATIGVPAGQIVRLYHESYRILRSSVGEIRELSDFGQFQRTASITSNLKIGSTMEGGFEVYNNIGKGGKVTHKDLYALMQAKGVALPGHLGGMAEDFSNELGSFGPGGTGSHIINAIDKTAAGVDRIMNPLKPKFGKAPYSVNRFTANRDTWSRGVMFLGAMRSKKFANIEQAADYAAQFVHKWAPTAIDLGGMETKYARRMVFYYTWLRGMVPRIIEGTLISPGAAMAPSKTMYNLGLANGLDLNSIGDPFPPDKLMPSWYSQKVLGPQYMSGGDLWGFNPTGPVGDTLNSLGSNVSPKDFVGPDAYTKIAGTFLNMSTPWFKAPMELATGKNLISGAPIEDKIQYVQDMIGPLRTASRISGKDLYAGFGPNGPAMPNRTEKKFRNGMTGDQTLQNALPELLNWATGMQFTNYTSDSASNSAFYQQKQNNVNTFKNDARFR